MRSCLEDLRRCLSADVDNVVLLEVADSTHAMARELIDKMDEEDQALAATVIIADRQERGEGRGSRSWLSPPGGLYLSWVRSGLDPKTIAALPMLAAAAARSAIEEAGVHGAAIKWPNDILVGGCKLAGIVIFARHGEPSWVAVGLGVNIDVSPDLGDPGATPPTSLSTLLGEGQFEERRNRIACGFVNRLTHFLTDPDAALAEWRRYLLQQPGDRVAVRPASGSTVEGTLVDIGPDGYLRIRDDSGERVVTGGDIIES